MRKKENEKSTPQKKMCIVNATRLLFVCVAVLFLPQTMLAQTQKRTITGQVNDNQGPIAGSLVQLKGTSIAVGVGEDGNFSLDIPTNTKTDPVLVFSFMGYETTERRLGKEDHITVTLKKDTHDLNGVTVVAYGKRDRRNLVTAVSSVKAKDIADMPSASLGNLLQGKMAGVQVINQSGAPGGGGTSVNIRGVNSLFVVGQNGKIINDGQPLYVIDGVPIASETSSTTGISGLAEIDPSTIESVSVLKDAASAALYGSRAANGVILITTKQGMNGKAKITANVSYGRSILPTTPEQTIGKAERAIQLMMAQNTRQAYYQNGAYVMPQSYNEVYNKYGAQYDSFFGSMPAGSGRGSNAAILQDSINPYYNNSTNWWKKMFRPSSTVDANLTIQGGTELIKYMVAAGVYSQKGIMPNSNFQRGNITSNLSIVPRKGLTINSHTYLAYTDKSRSVGSTNGAEAMTVAANAISSMYAGSDDYYNQVQSKLNGIVDKSYSYRLIQSLKANVELYKGLNFSSSISLDLTQQNQNTFYPALVAPNPDRFNESKGSITTNTTVNNENMLTYHWDVKEDHHFDFLLGQTYLFQGVNSIAGGAENTGSDYIHYVPTDASQIWTDANGNVKSLMDYSSFNSKSFMISYLGRVAYNYKKKYMFETTLRRDGSSVFGESKRWATFPSLAAGWLFTDESFMKNLYWLSEGKLRASWGQTGVQFSDPYLARGLLETSGYSFLGQPGLSPAQLVNSNLGWEQSDQYDLGLDMSFLDYRLQFKADYYYKYLSQQIYPAYLPGDVFYMSKEWQNAMETSNQGVELELNYDVLRGGKFTWKTSLMLNRNWNKFEKSYLGTDLDQFVIGAPSCRLWVYKTNGLIEKASDIPTTVSQNGVPQKLSDGGIANPYQVGMHKIVDINGDGVIDPTHDLVAMGSTFPFADGGWTNTFHYGDFDASVLVTFTIGRDIINEYKYSGLNYSGMSTTMAVAPLLFDASKTSFWSPTNNDPNALPVPGNKLVYNTLYTPDLDANIEHVSYARLKKITLGYRVPSSYVHKMKLQGLRFYGTIENLFLLSNYSGVDPESVPIQTGLDNGSNYPMARTFTLGMSIDF